jgi:hypothetical protein
VTHSPELELPGLDRQPVQVTTTWLDTRRLEFTLECANAPILLALVLRWGDRGQHGRIHRSNADPQARVRLSFFSRSDEPDTVLVRWFQRQGHVLNDGPCLLLHHRVLRENPRPFVQVLVESPEQLHTGSVSRLAEIGSEVSADVLVIMKHDTRATHARWRVRPEHLKVLPAPYQFLANGSQHGHL